MKAPLYSNLRDLGRDHYHGTITCAQYRAARKQLIDRFVEAHDTQSLDEPEDSFPVRVNTTEIRSVAPDPVANRGILILFVIVLSVLGTISGWFFLIRGASDEHPPDDQVTTVQTLDRSDTEANPAQSVIETFLTADDWSHDSLARFALDWSALLPERQKAARNTPWFRMLSDRLHAKILEQQALMDIKASKPPDEQEQVLLSLARQLDLAWVDNNLVDTVGRPSP